MKVLIVQFLKTTGDTGELEALRFVPGVAIHQMGCGFIPREDPALGNTRRRRKERCVFRSDALASGKYDQVI
jgi:ATP:corrinoid adenosyltransferase